MAAKALLTTKWIEFFSTKKFALATLGNNNENLCGLVLEAKNVLITVFAKYFDYIAIFSPNSTTKLPKCIGINNYSIKMSF